MPGKLRVLQFICSTGFYGAERWILALARNFDPEKIICDLVTTRESGSADLELARIYREEFSNLGEAFDIPMSNRFDLRSVNRLVKLIEDHDVDVIHTHGYKSDIIGVLAARKAGIKCVVTPHGFENAADLKLRFFIWLGCKAMKYADSVVPLSLQIVDDVKQLGIDADRIHYIQNGVDLSEIEAVYQDPSVESGNGKSRRIGFIGQLISRKNVDEILDIFDMLADRRESIELQLIGDGDQRTLLESHADRLRSRERIQFMGFRNDRLELLKKFDLFVMTSTLEGVPRCIMEAMAMGVPVAAYDIPGIDQLIENEVTGLVAPMGDRQRLTEHWERLLFDDEFSAKIRNNARHHVHSRFSAARMADEYMDHYQQLLRPVS